MTSAEAIARHLRKMIEMEGPISVATFMAAALNHPKHGYYMTRDPFGAGGDFVTAPEISQMFGELIGLWCVDTWQRLGEPAPFRLIELGPGRGTLMADALRAAKVMPSFLAAADVNFVEISPALRHKQRQRVPNAEWHDRLDDIPEGPFLLVANEFFDALPVHQFVKTERGYCERRVALDPGGAFTWRLAPDPVPDALFAKAVVDAPEGTIAELSPAGRALAAEIAGRIARHGGAALLVDYGYEQPATGDTFQALKGHEPQDPLDAPGAADLTAHVDFSALAAVAALNGAGVHGPLGQGGFLSALGIETRAALLGAKVPERKLEFKDAARRLTGPDAMGRLFRVLALTPKDFGTPAGFGP